MGDQKTVFLKKIKNFSEKMWAAYQRAIVTRPLLTKMFTVAGLSGLGDCLSQNIESSISKQKKPYDFIRTGRMMTFGFFIAGPLNHHWYGILERMAWRFFTSKYNKNSR